MHDSSPKLFNELEVMEKSDLSLLLIAHKMSSVNHFNNGPPSKGAFLYAFMAY
jgi:hypothetical protein